MIQKNSSFFLTEKCIQVFFVMFSNVLATSTCEFVFYSTQFYCKGKCQFWDLLHLYGLLLTFQGNKMFWYKVEYKRQMSTHLLCITTSKQVVCIPFVGKNLFQTVNNFPVTNRKKLEKGQKQEKPMKNGSTNILGLLLNADWHLNTVWHTITGWLLGKVRVSFHTQNMSFFMQNLFFMCFSF